MQTIDGRPVYAATDLVGFLACEHRLALERAALAAMVTRPERKDPSVEAMAKRGDEHERRYRDSLEAEGRRVVDITTVTGRRLDVEGDGTGARGARDRGAELRAAQAATVAAMREGADVVYQGTFFDGTWLGKADFLHRVDHRPGEPDSAFGPWHYEVADTKLARHVKASAILQICSYVEQLTALQGRSPERFRVVLGGAGAPTEHLRTDDYMAFYRRAKASFEEAVGLRGPGRPVAYPPRDTYPEPVEHCDVCNWREACEKQRRADDHLSLVAGATRRQRDALVARDVPTRRALAVLDLPLWPALDGVAPPALARIREQARLQVASDGLKVPLWELLEPERAADGTLVPDRGLLGLPAPSPGDLFLDLEGDPYALDDGVDYLFGVLEPALPEVDPAYEGRTMPPRLADLPRVPRFHAFWALEDDAAGRPRVTAAAERRAFEAVVDLILDRRRRDPGLHVYHYAAYETTAFGRLAQRYGTREEEVDDLLRGGVFVDLFRAVRQGVRVGVESYSIKKLEPLYGLRREIELRDANSSIVEFETWLELGDDEPPATGRDILRNIALYNRDDVVSTLALRDWLEERRADLARELGHPLPRHEARGSRSERGRDEDAETRALVEALTAGVPDDRVERATDPAGAARWLLAQLLDWHRREDKSTWWRFFELMKQADDALLDAREPVAGLEPAGLPEEFPRGKVVWTFRYPEQQHDLEAGDTVYDPRVGPEEASETGFPPKAGTVEEVDLEHGILRIARGSKEAALPLPTALVPTKTVETRHLRASLRRTAGWVVEHGIDSPAPTLRAARRLLARRPPLDGEEGTSLRLPGETEVEAAVRLVLALDGEVLAIQGPPGAGKTYAGASMAVALARTGRRVGVTANSHRVIGNLLDAIVERDAATRRPGTAPVRVGQKPKDRQKPTCHAAAPLEKNEDVAALLRGGGVDVVGAVAWTWCLEAMASPGPILDVLIVEEAGQMSLANVIACAPAARTIVLLGDPQQLDQPIKGSHPPGAERSALGHLLADPAGIAPDRATIPAHQGLFLEHTRRLHPSIAGFTSTAFYEGKLGWLEELAAQRILGDAVLAGTGLRLVDVVHEGNATASHEEAEVVVDLVREALGARAAWRDAEGAERPLRAGDVIVVAPYNDHVGAIGRALERAGLGEVSVGTVDKFQGQERPVSIYAMGTSAPELAPRGLEFLYSTNRLNVATSRARAVAAVVCSPALFRVACHTPRQMRLVNALCLAAEAAGATTRVPERAGR